MVGSFSSSDHFIYRNRIIYYHIRLCADFYIEYITLASLFVDRLEQIYDKDKENH